MLTRHLLNVTPRRALVANQILPVDVQLNSINAGRDADCSNQTVVAAITVAATLVPVAIRGNAAQAVVALEILAAAISATADAMVAAVVALVAVDFYPESADCFPS